MKNNTKQNLHGLKIRTFNYVMIAIACVLYIFLLYVTIHTFERFNELTEVSNVYISCEQDAGQVSSGSDYLTEQVRLYAITAEKQYMDNYFTEANVTRRRDKALEDLRLHMVSDEIAFYLQAALNASNQLMKQEFYSMKLVSLASGYDLTSCPQEVQDYQLSEEDKALSPEEMMELAQELVFGKSYQNSKALINDYLSQFVSAVLTSTGQQQEASTASLRQSLVRQRIYISLLFVMNVITFVAITILIVKPLNVYVKCIEENRLFELIGSYEFKHLALTYNSIYELNAVNEALLRHKADHDPLTGILNRGAFEQVTSFLENNNKPIALMLIDVDKFKFVNDNYGHEVGDRILQKVANLLAQNLRSTDTPARIGGDEFAAILTDITEAQRQIIQQKVNYMNSILSDPKDGLPSVSLSVGVAFTDKGYSTALYTKADSALYQVKKQGRCGVAFYEE